MVLLKLSDSVPAIGESLYVVQQNCDYYSDRNCYFTKKVSFGELKKVEGNSYTHNADTLGGSSGSPIFSKSSNKVMSLFTTQALGNNGRGRGLENYGVSMAKIVSHKVKFPKC